MEHDEGADALEAEADDMQQGSEALGDRIDSARSDWKAKQSDESIPGAIDADAARPGGPGAGGEHAKADEESDGGDDESGDDDKAPGRGDGKAAASSGGEGADADDKSGGHNKDDEGSGHDDQDG